MRRAHTVEQVRAAEAALMAQLPEGMLMQRAASGLATACLDLLGYGYGARVALLVGGGDNGGDVLHAGARLAKRGARVEAVLLSRNVHERGLAALRAAGGRVVPRIERADLVVDGIVGIGGRPGLRDNAVAALDSVAGVPIVAADVPSGVDVDSGETPGPHVCADLTVTFGTHKVGLLLNPAAAAAGAVHLVDIGLTTPDPAVESLQAADVAGLLPWPAPDQHKYSRGVLGVAAGSAQFPGAAVLVVRGALAGFTGMVRFLGDGAELTRAVQAAHPEVVAGRGRVQAWAVGSGGGAQAEEYLETALADRVPVLVDADGLAHLEAPLEVPTLLTPHAGELARMLDVDRSAVEAAPLQHARQAAERYDATVLLKGNRTVVADPSGRVRVNATGVPWLATAGAGDVLSGVCGSLLAAGLTPLDAGSVGAWLHGAAAAQASAGGPVTASAVASAVPAVVSALR